jgi:hypothetical protein
MKTLMRVFLVVMALAALSGISVGDASAQWTPAYNYYGVWADGGVGGHPAGPTDYHRNSLAWGRLGWNADQQYGIGIGGGIGPSSSGNIGIKIPGMQQYNLKWW